MDIKHSFVPPQLLSIQFMSINKKYRDQIGDTTVIIMQPVCR